MVRKWLVRQGNDEYADDQPKDPGFKALSAQERISPALVFCV